MVHIVNPFCKFILIFPNGGQMMALVTKTTRFNLRVTDDFKAEIEALAAYYGITPSSMAHSLLVRAMREERIKTPEAFGTHVETSSTAKMAGRIGPGKPTKDAVRIMYQKESEIEEIGHVKKDKKKRAA